MRAAGGTGSAYFGTGAAGCLVEFRSAQQERGARAADLGAVQHHAGMPVLQMIASVVQAVLGEGPRADSEARHAGFGTSGQLGGWGVGGHSHDRTPIAGWWNVDWFKSARYPYASTSLGLPIVACMVPCRHPAALRAFRAPSLSRREVWAEIEQVRNEDGPC